MTNFGVIILFIIAVCLIANVWLWYTDRKEKSIYRS